MKQPCLFLGAVLAFGVPTVWEESPTAAPLLISSLYA